MSDSREQTPDWVNSFKAPAQSLFTLSSDSDSSRSNSPIRYENKFSEEPVAESRNIRDKGPVLIESEEESPTMEDEKPTRTPKKGKRKKDKDFKSEEDSLTLKDKRPRRTSNKGKQKGKQIKDEDIESEEENLTLKDKKPTRTPKKGKQIKDEDIEGEEETLTMNDKKQTRTPTIGKQKKEEDIESEEESLTMKGKKPTRTAKKGKQMKDEDLKADIEDANEGDLAVEEGSKLSLPNVSSRVPLILPEKVQRSKALVECDGDSIDLSGDVGAVGRVVVSDTSSGDPELLLDLKGTIYKSTIVPSTTFCIVSFGQTEAKIEAIMTDYIQLKPHSNVFEAETMIEGTLEGFSFDSEDEADKLPKMGVQHENGDQTNAKGKRKNEKSLGPMRKKAKTAAKRVVRKPQATKKGKTSKK